MTVKLIEGDCIAAMRAMAERGETVHAVVTDPPYHLTSVVKRFGGEGAAPAQHGTDGAFARASAGFMGKQWDGGDIAFRPETWRLCYDLLPPGGHLVAFGGTRTFHRMAVAIEDAGFELRDTLMWLYGTGFPKSHDVSKGIDKMLGAERERAPPRSVIGHQRNVGNLRPYMLDPNHTTVSDEPASAEAAEWTGWGTALKPAWEPIILARKPLAGTVAANVLAHRTGALNVDGCRVPGAKPDTTRGASPGRCMAGEMGAQGRILDDGKGRWPANVLHDGSAEVGAAFAAFGEKSSGTGAVKRATAAGYSPNALGKESRPAGTEMVSYGDTGSASRFFYSAKASAADRAGSKHPTVKPVALVRWLVRLVCPPGGTVLDPFAGSGTTGAAAMAEGMGAVLIEAEPEYQADIRRRLGLAAPARSEASPFALDLL